MSTELHQQGDPVAAEIPSNLDASIGIVVADWNSEITHALLEGAVSTLKQYGIAEEDIFISHVPGTVELTFAARQMALIKEPSAVIVLGCVIQGDTPHFNYVCDSVTKGITELNLRHDIPFIFGVLTTLNVEQAQERAGGRLGNKGSECAETALKMVDMMAKLINS